MKVKKITIEKLLYMKAKKAVMPQYYGTMT